MLRPLGGGLVGNPSAVAPERAWGTWWFARSLLSGRLPLRAGRRMVGDRVRIGVFSQDLAQDLPADKTGLEVLGELAFTDPPGCGRD